MSSYIYSSQIKHSDRIHDSKIFIDELAPSTTVAPASPEAQELLNIGLPTMNSGALGSTQVVQVNLPSYGCLRESWLEVNLNATTAGTYCDYVGLSLLSGLRVTCNGQEVINYDRYDILLNALINKWEPEKRASILNACGGVGFTSGIVIVPLILPWSCLLNTPSLGARPPLLTHLLNEKTMNFEFRVRPIANLLAPGGTASATPISYTNLRMLIMNIPPETMIAQKKLYSSTPYVYKSIDFQTVPPVDVPSSLVALSGQADLSSIKGCVRSYDVCSVLLTSITANRYFAKTPIDSLQLMCDGQEVYRQITNNDSIHYLNIVSGGSGIPITPSALVTPLGEPSGIISWGSGVCDPSAVCAYYNTFDTTTITLFMSQSQGSDCWISACASIEAIWRIRDGILEKLR